MSNDKFKNRCYAISIIASNNSNFNADFTGNPRRLPDEEGTIFATDKVYKYAIRRYWVDDGKDVFVWRSHNSNGKLKTREERMEYMKNKLKDNEILKKLNDEKEKVLNEINNIKDPKSKKGKDDKKFKEEKIAIINQKITKYIFSECIDTKLFGVTYTGKDDSIALTGPVQISYGINKFNSNINYMVDILSPYPNIKNKENNKDATDEETKEVEVNDQASIGKDMKNLVSYYVYDISLNPKNITSHYKEDVFMEEMMSLNEKDISELKKALRYSVTAMDTSSKKDSENLMLLFIEMNDSQKFLPSMKTFVNIDEDADGKVSVNLNDIIKILKENKENIKLIELFYNNYKIKSDYGQFKKEFGEKLNLENLY